MDQTGIELTTSRLRQLRQLPVVQHVRFTPLKSRQKNATPMTCPWLHWTTDNLSGMHMVSISTPVCVNFELRPGAGNIHICWFNFDALAQGNAYKPTKEPKNYHGPDGDNPCTTSVKLGIIEVKLVKLLLHCLSCRSNMWFVCICSHIRFNILQKHTSKSNG